MYKNFTLTEAEAKEILNQHKEHGYKQPIQELTLGMGDPNMGQPRKKIGSLKDLEQQYDLDTIVDLVNDAVGDSLSDQSVARIVDDIQADYLNNDMDGLDIYDYVNQYLKDWVREARTDHSGSGFGGGSRIKRGENGTIWGDDWETVIDRATQIPEPDDDQIMNGFGREGGISYKMNEAKERLKATFKKFS